MGGKKGRTSENAVRKTSRKERQPDRNGRKEKKKNHHQNVEEFPKKRDKARGLRDLKKTTQRGGGGGGKWGAEWEGQGILCGEFGGHPCFVGEKVGGGGGANLAVREGRVFR